MRVSFRSTFLRAIAQRVNAPSATLLQGSSATTLRPDARHRRKTISSSRGGLRSVHCRIAAHIHGAARYRAALPPCWPAVWGPFDRLGCPYYSPGYPYYNSCSSYPSWPNISVAKNAPAMQKFTKPPSIQMPPYGEPPYISPNPSNCIMRLLNIIHLPTFLRL